MSGRCGLLKAVARTHAAAIFVQPYWSFLRHVDEKTMCDGMWRRTRLSMERDALTVM